MGSKGGIILAAGGTGGHLFPAQALARKILEERPGVELLFAGTGLSTSRYFDREEFNYCDLPSASPFVGGFWRRMKALPALVRGVLQAVGLLRREKPDLVVGFGSFHAFPVLAAAWLLKLPIILFEPNIFPGRVNRLFAPAARLCAVQFAETSPHLGRAVQLVAAPTSCSVCSDRAAARQFFGLQPDRFTLLIFGGSQGAASLNQLMKELAALRPELLNAMQLIHLAGQPAAAEEMVAAYAGLPLVSVRSFEQRMDLAYAAADLALCRAGAATVAELVAFEVPSLLVPYPHGSDRHQHANAAALERQGCAKVELEETLTVEKLALCLKELQEGGLQRMRTALAILKQEQRHATLWDLVREVWER